MSKMFSKATSAFKGHNDAASNGSEEGESLTTILESEEDRSALTILIADCTESMRQVIVDAFDAKETGQKGDQLVNTKGKGDENTPPAEQEKTDTAAKDQQAKELAKREKELSEEKMQDLKNAALKFFDEWRSSVIQRVGEVVNSREKAESHKHKAKPKKEDEEPKAAPEMKFPDLPKYDEGVQRSMMELYPPVQNTLRRLPEEQKALILHSLLLLLLSLEHYQSHSRVLMLHISTSLHLPIDILAHDESKVARVLLTAAENMSADDEKKKRAEENKSGRRWKVGLATVGGAALLAVTGGLAAPLLAAGIGTVMGGLGLGATAAAGYLGALAGSSVLVGGLFGAYGGRMTGRMMDQYAREVEDFAFVPVTDFHKPRKIEKEYRRLRVGVGITGWLTNQDEVVDPWKVLGVQLESFALRWELEALMSLGNAMTTMVTSAAWSVAKVEIIKRTVFGALSAGLWPLALLKVSRVLDNPFSVANYRAVKAGEVLADALINKAQGERPVTLVGYSLGAKVIFTCLQHLAQRKAFGLVESVVLIGTPAPSTAADWRMIRSVVSGRVVNVFSSNDYILGFLYRSHSVQLGVAGLQAVENVKGVENVDVSDMIKGHTSYRFATGSILQKIGFEDVDSEAVEEEEMLRKNQEMKEELESERAESEQKEKDDATKTGDAATKATGEKGDVSDEYVNNLEKEIEKKNEQSYVGWAQEKMVGAGTSAKVALEKARLQWRTRNQTGEAGNAAKSAGESASHVPSAA
ncbi:hypothetical protein M409DRAFT_17056 [Zasmidium cellare ATCC 36951]|uniref:DUF726-domain-containing protein n=1 Tax=Zasmidium cellare ATCC 36951 TaxID=1080233 RepID=A0A6A6D0W3_ZASCE|nr:uncharacterized protein M409DRAFT_17056 [Zasmidium cellare ATCC 36951]KAF2173107.1 hypothetical protein M409DRAFT_17056 [Zasmidium cellare ATCC 36951]